MRRTPPECNPSSARRLCRIPESLQRRQDPFAVVTLDLDAILGNRASGGTQRLELLQHGRQIRPSRIKSRDDRDDLAAAPPFSADTDLLLPGRAQSSVTIARTPALCQRPCAGLARYGPLKPRTIKEPRHGCYDNVRRIAHNAAAPKALARCPPASVMLTCLPPGSEPRVPLTA